MSVINTNTVAEQTSNNLRTSHNNLAKSLARLSSGSRIVNPSDDAAGLAVSSRLESQIKRLDAALNNVVNAVSFTQTQDGFLKTIDRALRRMSELAMLAQDTTKSEADRKLYNEEFEQLKQYIGQTADKDFNGVLLFGGDLAVLKAEGPVKGLSLAEDGVFKTASAHLFKTGDAVRFSTTNELPEGLEPFTKYYVVKTGIDSFALSNTKEQALAVPPVTKVIHNKIPAPTAKAAIIDRNIALQDGVFATSGPHPFSTGDSIRFSSTGTLPEGIQADTNYFVVKISDSSFKLSTTQEGAMGAIEYDENGQIVSENPANATDLLEIDDTIEITDPEDENSTIVVPNSGSGTLTVATEFIANVGMGNHSVIAAESEQAVTIDAAGTTFKMPGIDLTVGGFPEAIAKLTNIETPAAAVQALKAVNDAIGKIALDRAKLGAVQSRLNFTNDQLTTTKENLSSAISRIADVDVAQEATEYARYQILVQSGTSMLAQANALPRSVLELLR